MVFLIDEASGVPEQIFEAAQGALSTEGARILMAANPTRLTGYFYNSHHKNRDSWTRFRFSCLDSPNVDKSYPCLLYTSPGGVGAGVRQTLWRDYGGVGGDDGGGALSGDRGRVCPGVPLRPEGS